MNQAQILAAELGATPQRFDEIRRLPYPQAVKALEQLKADVRANYKKCAFKYHPDRNPDDPEGATQKFKLLAVIVERIQKFRVRPPQPQVPVIRRQFVFVPGFVTTSTTNTATTTGMPFHVIYHHTVQRVSPHQARSQAQAAQAARKTATMKPE